MYKSLNKEALQELISLGFWSEHSTPHERVVDDDYRWVFDTREIDMLEDDMLDDMLEDMLEEDE